MLKTLSLTVLAVVAALAAPSRAADDETSKIAHQLNAAALRFDTNHDGRLSADEQAALIKFVSEKRGEQWGKRLAELLKAADVNGDGAVDEAEWKAAVAKFAGRAAQPAERFAKPERAKQTSMVAMRDGVKLATDVYLPDGPGPFPVVLTRTPYSRAKSGGSGAAGLNASGMAVVVQDMRGRFDSEGENFPFIGCGWGEHQDGVDTVAWLLKQPWCNGKIGTVGGSACGITQNLLAATGAPGLVAQHIAVAPASMYHHASYVGGALRKCQVENWQRGNHFDPKALETALAHPSYDDHWRAYDTTLRFAQMNVPAVHVGGWFDTFQQGTIDSFIGRQHHGGDGARGKQKLVIGPWEHGGWRHEGVGDLVFPNAQMPGSYTAPHWFDYHLKGIDNGVMQEPAVAYYTMGDTQDPQAPGNQWRQADDWPIPSQATPYYLGKEGVLGPDRPAAAEASLAYTFDPADPCPTIGGNNLTIPRGPRNQNKIESRKDVLLFTTGPLPEPLEVTGRVRAKISVAASTADSDLSLRLCDVYPDGKSYLIAEGMLRLRYRKSFEKPEPMVPGEIVEADVDCWSTSIVFNRGHRIRVTVTSSNFPRFDVNPGTGQPWSDDGPKLKQTNRIYCDSQHASCLVLPVVAGKQPGVAHAR